jgi:hypothetical protein
MVSGICATACANYLFLTGHFKILDRQSHIFWSGSSSFACEHTLPVLHLEMTDDLCDDFMLEIMQVKELNADFFKSINADDRITCLSKDIFDSHDELGPKDHLGFTLDATSMNSFSVRNMNDLRENMVIDGFEKTHSMWNIIKLLNSVPN